MSSAAVQAFIAFLRCEAQQAEERAKSLRATAAAIEANTLEGRCDHRTTVFHESRKADLFFYFSFTAGIKKRKRDPSITNSKSIKTHSAYTMFVHENFELIRKDHADLATREIISMLARQWGSTSEEEKQIWKYRAEQSRDEPFPTIPGILPEVPDIGDDTSDEDDDVDDVDEESGGGKRRATRKDGVAVSV